MRREAFLVAALFSWICTDTRDRVVGEPQPIVRRSSMEEWRLGTFQPPPPGPRSRIRTAHNNMNPVIEAFYRNIPPKPTIVDQQYSDTHFRNAHTNAGDIEKPQRIKINSEVLLDDLQRISGLTLPNNPHLYVMPEHHCSGQ